MQKLFFIILLILFFIPALARPDSIQKVQVPVKMNQLNFEQSIAELSKIFDTRITLVNLSSLPQQKFSIALEQATVEQAVKETLRKADLQSYALIWEQENKAMRIWILRSKYGKLKENSIPDHDENQYLLTLAQMKQLETNDGFNHTSLSPEQMQKLNPNNDEMLNNKTLSTEQMQRLDQEEEEKKPKTLNKEQMQRLDPYKKINPDNNKKLTKEQMRLLEKEPMKP